MLVIAAYWRGREGRQNSRGSVHASRPSRSRERCAVSAVWVDKPFTAQTYIRHSTGAWKKAGARPHHSNTQSEANCASETYYRSPATLVVLYCLLVVAS